MYQAVAYQQRTNTVHIWDDQKGHLQIKYKPYAYRKSGYGKYVALDGNTVDKVFQFDKEEEGLYEADINPETRTLIDMYTDSDDLSVGHSTMFIDIEVDIENGFPTPEEAQNEVTSIAIYDQAGNSRKVWVLDKAGVVTSTNLITSCRTEYELLQQFLLSYYEIKPTIITGWNIRFFDIPYLYNRMRLLLGEKITKRLSPWNIIKEKKVTRKRTGQEETVFDIVGVATLDYMELYETFTYINRESYSLNYIAYVELGEKKLDYTEYESIQEFYQKNFQKFIEYNIKDVKLVEQLDNKLQLIKLAVSLAYSAGVNFSDVFSQVKTWDVIIYNYLAKRNIIIPSKKKSRKDEQYIGAYVKEPIVGMHKWVVSFDLNSLYPHLIMQYNISPETLTADGMRGTVSPDGIMKNGEVSNTYLENNKSKDLSTAANGTTYVRSRRGFLPDLMNEMYKDRKMYKSKMIQAEKELEAVKNELKKRGIS